MDNLDLGVRLQSSGMCNFQISRGHEGHCQGFYICQFDPQSLVVSYVEMNHFCYSKECDHGRNQILLYLEVVRNAFPKQCHIENYFYQTPHHK